VRTLSIDDVERLVEPGYFERGVGYCDRGRVTETGRWRDRLVAEVLERDGDGHRVFLDVGERVRATCSCRSIRRTPFCTHAAAVLVAWSRDPRTFRRLSRNPERPAPAPVRSEDPEAVASLRRMLEEIGEAGLSHLGEERVAALRRLWGGLRTSGFRRLAGRVAEFAARPTPEALVDLVFAARGAQRASSEDPRHFGELRSTPPGKPIRELRLLQIHFGENHTADGFRVQSSHFFDLTSGEIFVETLLHPRRRTWDRKRSYADLDLHVREGRVHPGFSPRRLKLIDVVERPLGPEGYSGVVKASTSVTALRDRYGEWRREPLAPRSMEALVRTSGYLVRGGRLFLVDESGDLLPIECEGIPVRRIVRALAPGALHARLVFREGALRAEPLSTVREGGVIPWTGDPLS